MTLMNIAYLGLGFVLGTVFRLSVGIGVKMKRHYTSHYSH